MSNMVDVPTEELTGLALDWATDAATTGEALKVLQKLDGSGKWMFFYKDAPFPQGPVKFSTDSKQASALLERYKPLLMWDATEQWKCCITPEPNEPNYYFRQYGPTALIALCRAIVARELGSTTISVPKELVS